MKERGEVCVSNVLRFLRMYMCIEFLIQVLRQKNEHAFLPVGMVFCSLTC